MNVFTAIAEPTRRKVLDQLLVHERSAGEISELFPNLTQPAVSRHLRVLREAGLVRVRVDEQRRVYSLSEEGMRDLHAWLDKHRQFWGARLDALEAHLDSEERKSKKRRQ